MRWVLIDECLPAQLHRWLEPVDAHTVEFLGWKGLDDDALLAAAREQFDVLLTGDAAIVEGHDLAVLGLAVVIARHNHKTLVRQLLPVIQEAVAAAERGGVIEVQLAERVTRA